ncbi:hypothetical protein YYG_02535 [Plasmodium vinckei petteri]|uniref:Immune mapped protein 2 N-terminal domain-containing protein n=1 Tax=Plasmodium vinckei petteri TaxID=138298 RepID=W7AVQ0_PLAVN|nr:hypothetical protein YYG_02535 [Plasmodium vinckei petteri]CAD2109267.1 conserved Plasmodium protein, unknown function [Plasmodium vinckei petteri]
MAKNAKTVEKKGGKEEKKNTANKKKSDSKDQTHNKLKSSAKENEKKGKDKSLYMGNHSTQKDSKLQTRLERDSKKNAEKNVEKKVEKKPEKKAEKKVEKKPDKRYSHDKEKHAKNKNVNFRHSEMENQNESFLCCFCCGGKGEELGEVRVNDEELKLLEMKKRLLEEEEEKKRLKMLEDEEKKRLKMLEDEEKKRQLKILEEEEEEEEKRRLKMLEDEEEKRQLAMLEAEEEKRQLAMLEEEEDEVVSQKKKETVLVNKDMKVKLFTKKKAKLNFLGAAAAPTPPEEKHCVGPPPEVRKTTVNISEGIYLIYSDENCGQLEIHYSKIGIKGRGVLAYISSETIPDFYFDQKHSKQIILKNISTKLTSGYSNDLKPYYECYIEFIKLKKKFNGTLYFLPAFEAQPPPHLDIIFFNTREKKLIYAPIEKPVEISGDILFVIQKGLKIFKEEVEVEKLCNYMKCYGALLNLS